MFKLKPSAGYLVVEPISSSDFNKSGLAEVPDEKERISTGKVVEVGGDAIFEGHDGIEFSSEWEEGEIVVYKEYTEQKLTIDNKDFVLVRFDHVIATIEEK